jgi:LemA protein
LVVLTVGATVVEKRNSLVVMDEGINSSWAEVENQLKRRNELIPAYVETVKGYAKHEQAVFDSIAKSAKKLDAAQTMDQKIDAANKMSSGVSVLLNLVMKYPELKANQNFMSLQAELEGTQNRITVAIMRFNESVKRYNQAIRVLPDSVIAQSLGFKPRKYFEVQASEKKKPTVKF